MERSPSELLAQVCSLSNIRSLKRIRLVNNTFAQTTAQYMFEGLCIILVPRYLDKFIEVAFHRTLRFHVRTLYFGYDILDEKFAKYEVWKAEIGTGEPGTSIGEGTRAKVYAQADLDRSHINF